MSRIALDTSAAIPLLLRNHEAHGAVRARIASHKVSLTGHSLAETYSVLTRLPGDARLAVDDAAQILRAGFAAPLLLDRELEANLPDLLAAQGVAGGAVYDAMVGLAVKGTGFKLLTRDLRAVTTYTVLDVPFELV